MKWKAQDNYWVILRPFLVIISPTTLEQSCCKNRQKSPKQKIGLGNKGRLNIVLCFLFRIRVYGRLWPPRPPFFIRFLGPRGFKYVSSFSGCICHEYLNFIQSGCGHCVVRFLGILRRGGGGGMLSQLIDFVNDCFIPRISTRCFIFPFTKESFNKSYQ